MSDLIFLDKKTIVSLHSLILIKTGGIHGRRSEENLKMALDRPKHKQFYVQSHPLDLAASYAYGLCALNPFFDGNKKISFIAMELFLNLNGIDFFAPENEIVLNFQELANEKISESELLKWITKWSVLKIKNK